MGISTEEQETVITWSRGDKTAHIYTSDSVMMARLKKRQENNPEEYKNLKIGKLQSGEDVSVDVDIPLNLLTIRKKTAEKREMTEEEKEKARERFALYRKKKQENSGES